MHCRSRRNARVYSEKIVQIAHKTDLAAMIDDDKEANVDVVNAQAQ
jgi:hypothetical protein